MSDRRSAIRSNDNRVEKHVAFKSPVMSVRSITPDTNFDNFRSPTRAQQQQNQLPKRPPSTNPPQGGTPAKQRRGPVEAVQLPPANATLDDAVVRNTLRVQMINEKVNGFFGQIPSIFEIANATLDKTSGIVLGLHMLDNIMYRYIEQEKVATQTLNKFLKDLNEAEELDLSGFTEEFEKIEEALDADIDRLNRLIAEDEEHDKEKDDN